MTDGSDNGRDPLSQDFLRSARQLVENNLDDVDAEREDFFTALFLLQNGDVSGAVDEFRKAARTSGSPFDALSMVALGECQRLRGKEGAAIREWKKIADDEDAPHAARYVAWLSLASVAEAREDEALLERANEALEEIQVDDLQKTSLD
jgi:lipopolysaccharide biosynthesis regulator YciM